MVWNCQDDFQPSGWFETVWMVWNCLDGLKLSGIICIEKLHVSAESWKQEYGYYDMNLLGRRLTQILPNWGKHVAHDGQARYPWWASSVPILHTKTVFMVKQWSRSVENMVYANQQQYYDAITANSNVADSGPFIDFMLGEIQNRAWTQWLPQEQVHRKAAGIRRRPSRTPYRRHRCLRHALHRLREVLAARFIYNCDWWSEIILGYLKNLSNSGVTLLQYL